MRRWWIIMLLAAPALALDLAHAVVVAPPKATPRETKAVGMLVDEVEKRTQVRWSIVGNAPGGIPAIEIGTGSGPPEGYRISTGVAGVRITGNDERGVLFGIGRLLRALRMDREAITLDDGFAAESVPKYQLRGHQLGYRPKTNSYDGWSVPVWEQYIRDLAVFGTNSIELIPPRSDDAPTSPHFPLPPMRMMIEMSRLLDEYGLDVWIWYPAMDRDYSDPATVEFALREWGEVFRQLPRVDAVFVPGGDPGHTEPKYLMALLEKQTQVLHRYHPAARMWVSPQSFDQQWLDQFIGILKTQPEWLSGIVFGPQVRISLPELRALVPRRYPIRHYPDITHSLQCQYPVPDWDVAYALTEGRETINPRPADEARIFHAMQPGTIGFITYSEGCNDDVNKIVWSALGWNPDEPVADILRDYGRYFIGDAYADSFAQSLLALERNWSGPLLTNAAVDSTLQQFQSMERAASTRMLESWRFQQALYRAYYDAYTRKRLMYETELENTATEKLRAARSIGAERAIAEAGEILGEADTRRVSQDWRSRVFELAEALFQSIRMQLSVPRYKAISVDRGANLDTIDAPLNDRRWLEARFAEVRKLPGEFERLRSIDEIVNWTDPGPGGFYDDLGNVARQPHLIRDPGTVRTGFSDGVNDRISWRDHAEALFDAPLRMHYEDLDPAAQYRIRVVYAGERSRQRIRLVANGGIEIHPLLERGFPIVPREFDIPREATRRGRLDLAWYGESGLGGNGRGCQVAEVWLLRK